MRNSLRIWATACEVIGSHEAQQSVRYADLPIGTYCAIAFLEAIPEEYFHFAPVCVFSLIGEFALQLYGS